MAQRGLRIIYENANCLSRREHIVTVVHPGQLVIDPTSVDHVKDTVRTHFLPASEVGSNPGETTRANDATDDNLK
jgi:hypothetical protein